MIAANKFCGDEEKSAGEKKHVWNGGISLIHLEIVARTVEGRVIN